MIISRTPFRISLFGGSTDYESYFSKHESLLIGFAINKYCYLSVRKTPSIFDYKSKLSYSKTEIVNNNSKINHDGVRGCLDFLSIRYGIELSHNADLPAQTGTGSSSAFVVGLLNCLNRISNKHVTKKELSQQAINVERNILMETGGIQDQIWSAYGGINSISIEKNGLFHVKPLPICEHFLKNFLERSILIYTGSTRHSFKIAKSYNVSSSQEYKHKIKELSHLAYEQFQEANIENIASLLDESWNYKKQISNLISNDRINNFYSQLSEDGMIGGKLLGSGGAGFIFGILSDKVDKKEFKKKYKQNYVDFGLDFEGSKIINE